MQEAEAERPAFLKRLNREQFEAATAPTDKPLLIFAGPGSGKTTTITCRIAYLLHRQVDARHILALTFSRKAADEMRNRCLMYVKYLPRFDPAFLTVANFHSFALKVLRYHYQEAGLAENFTVLSTYQQRQTLEHCINEYAKTHSLESLLDSNGDQDDEEMDALIEEEEPMVLSRGQLDKKVVFRMQSLIQKVKIKGDTHILTRAQKTLYDSYQSSLRAVSAIDYGDMLLLVTNMWRSKPHVLNIYRAQFQYILCDEFQDTNDVQLEMLTMLTRDVGKITVCGDDDQAIYSWRGATQRAFAQFEEFFPNCSKAILSENYRSTQNIVTLAKGLIGFNKLRTVKNIYTVNSVGPKAKVVIMPDPAKEARILVDMIQQYKEEHHLSYCEIAILVRLTKSGTLIEREITKRRIPLVTSAKASKSIWQSAEILDLMAYLRLTVEPEHDAAWTRVYNVPKRGIGKRKFQKIKETADLRHISLHAAAKLVIRTDDALAKAISPFLRLLEDFNQFTPDHDSVSVFKYILEKTQYEVRSDPETIAIFEHKLAIFSAVQSRSHVSDFLLAYELGEFDGSSKEFITLSTIHQAKGLEWEMVVLPRMNEGMCPCYYSRVSEDGAARRDMIEEERRLAYVAATRSRRFLLVSWAMEDEGRALYPSRFIEEMNGNCWEVVNVEADPEPENADMTCFSGKQRTRDPESQPRKRTKQPLSPSSP